MGRLLLGITSPGIRNLSFSDTSSSLRTSSITGSGDAASWSVIERLLGTGGCSTPRFPQGNYEEQKLLVL